MLYLKDYFFNQKQAFNSFSVYEVVGGLKPKIK